MYVELYKNLEEPKVIINELIIFFVNGNLETEVIIKGRRYNIVIIAEEYWRITIFD